MDHEQLNISVTKPIWATNAAHEAGGCLVCISGARPKPRWARRPAVSLRCCGHGTMGTPCCWLCWGRVAPTVRPARRSRCPRPAGAAVEAPERTWRRSVRSGWSGCVVSHESPILRNLVTEIMKFISQNNGVWGADTHIFFGHVEQIVFSFDDVVFLAGDDDQVGIRILGTGELDVDVVVLHDLPDVASTSSDKS